MSDFGIYIRIAFGFRTRALFFRWTIALFGAKVDLRLDREKVSLSYYFRLCTGSQTFSLKERLLDSLNRTIRSVSPSSSVRFARLIVCFTVGFREHLLL